MLNKPLIAFLLVGARGSSLVAGPRRVLRSGWLWAGLAIALLLLVALAGLAGACTAGRSSTCHRRSRAAARRSSQPRWLLLPFQFLLVSPVLAPVWIAGLVALLRRPALRAFRFFAIAWAVLVVVFLVTGGKPYYLAGLFPVAARGRSDRGRRLAPSAGRHGAEGPCCGAAIALSGLVSVVLALPVLPARDAGAVHRGERRRRRDDRLAATSPARSRASIAGVRTAVR